MASICDELGLDFDRLMEENVRLSETTESVTEALEKLEKESEESGAIEAIARAYFMGFQQGSGIATEECQRQLSALKGALNGILLMIEKWE